MKTRQQAQKLKCDAETASVTYGNAATRVRATPLRSATWRVNESRTPRAAPKRAVGRLTTGSGSGRSHASAAVLLNDTFPPRGTPTTGQSVDHHLGAPSGRGSDDDFERLSLISCTPSMAATDKLRGETNLSWLERLV